MTGDTLGRLEEVTFLLTQLEITLKEIGDSIQDLVLLSHDFVGKNYH